MYLTKGKGSNEGLTGHSETGIGFAEEYPR